MLIWTYKYTLQKLQTFGVSKTLLMSLKEVSCGHQGCINLLKNTVITTLKYYYHLK